MHKIVNLALALGLGALTAASLAGCSTNDRKELAHHHHDHEEGHTHESHGDHDHEGEEGEEHEAGVIVLEPEQAEAFGLKTVTVKPGAMHSTLKVSGVITESAEGSSTATARVAGTLKLAPGIEQGREVKAGTLIATVTPSAVAGGDTNRAARAAMEAARKEVERLKPLHEAGIVTTARYNEALAAYEQAKASYSPAASGAVTAVASGLISSLDARTGQFVEAGQPIATIVSSDRLTLRADVPLRHQQQAMSATGAAIRIPDTDEAIDITSLDGRRVASTTAAGSRGGYRPIFFTLRNNGTLGQGMPVEVYLRGESREGVISVPRAALYEQQGAKFVFVQLDEDCYRKVPVTVGEDDGINVEIREGLKGGENVVVKGVTAVRLAETSGAVPEGHSHSH